MSEKITIEELQAEIAKLKQHKPIRQRLYDAIEDCGEEGCWLSNVELANKIGCSIKAVKDDLRLLEIKGKIIRKRASRMLKII